ncbi:MAG: Mfa1 family fimbria major subunit [Muribaculaceae bacterium]|nr:Mfa1 family fimbria major subunit [Muribaculaceae bacterium]
MKNFSKFFLATAALGMILTGCSSDEPNGQVTPSDGDIYARLTLDLPVGSRSKTTDPDDDGANSDAGHEVGQEYENNVGSVLVVIASENNGTYTYITSNLADPHAVTGAGANTARPTYNVQFETSALHTYAGQEVYVFAYCNPTPGLVRTAAAAAEGTAEWTDFANTTGAVSNDEIIWQKNGFLMTNALTTTVTLPSQDDMNELYNTPQNPFSLGTVKVERASARFDFKGNDGVTIGTETVANSYAIKNHVNDEVLGYVVLDGMALMNQAINYYYLPRVSMNGQNSGAEAKMQLCGVETTTNYVVSPFATEKAATPLLPTFISSNYMFSPIDEANPEHAFDFTTLSYDAISTVLGGTDDNDEGWNATNKLGYKIWKYTTENTIPMVDNQRKGITTGIVFRGELKAIPGTALATAMNGTNIIYAYNGIIYGDLAMLKAAVLANPVSTLAETFKVAFKVDNITEETLNGITANLSESNGFTIYRPDGGKYPVYYPYYNRHNDNGNNTVMGAMEFATVRNNVYKIAVSEILEFGHPGKPGDDPDPEDPDDPDESPKTYFRVQVQVLPWVVRVNNVVL